MCEQVICDLCLLNHNAQLVSFTSQVLCNHPSFTFQILELHITATDFFRPLGRWAAGRRL